MGSIKMAPVEALADLYVDYAKEINDNIFEMFDSIEELITQQPYEPLYKAAKNFENAYNDDVLCEIRNQVKEWVAGDDSFKNIVTTLKMSETSQNKASQAQEKIVDAFENELKIHNTISSMNFNDDEEEADNEKISQRLDEILSEYTGKINDVVDDYSAKVRIDEEENEAVAAFVHLDCRIGNGIKEFIVGAIKQFDEVLSEETKARFESAHTKTQASKEAALAASEAIANQALEEATAFLQGLFS